MEEEKKKQSKKKCEINDLKENYNKLKQKYGLPDFDYLNQNFEIEQISNPDSDILLKTIRKSMTEKIFYILRTLEMFINPQNAPMFFFNIIKSFDAKDQENIKELYDRIVFWEIESFSLEAVYNEKKEAEFIKQLAEEWKNISENLMKVYDSMKKNYNKDSKKQSRSYFG